MANYFEMAFSGREQCRQFEEATANIFREIFGLDSTWLGSAASGREVPNILLISNDAGFQAIIDTKAYSRYDLPSTHRDRMIYHYLPDIQNYSSSGLPIGFFSYIAGGFSNTIVSPLNEIVRLSRVNGSAMPVTVFIKMTENNDIKPYSHDEIKKSFRLINKMTSETYDLEFLCNLNQPCRFYGGHKDMDNKANPHTIKKFEIIEGYVKSWIEKLMNYQLGGVSQCNKICFIDCMCNNGRYIDDNGTIIDGTPIRVARLMSEAMKKYPEKEAVLYFNDSDSAKIRELKKHLPDDTNNYHICLSCKNGNDLLKELSSKLLRKPDIHYLLFYDPYDASIDWTALTPYFFGWGEVILNHVVSDTIRSITSVKRPETKNKYQQTYLTAIEKLVDLHDDKNAYDKLIENIIKELGSITSREYYLASFPFFIKTNVRIYSIIFFSKSREGFKLFKKTAWKTFGDKSSNQNTHGKERQISLFDVQESRQCYYISDIADYIASHFKGQIAVPLEIIWAFVDEHPIFPTISYKTEIKRQLKSMGLCKIHKNTMDFV